MWDQTVGSRGFGRATRQDHFETFVYSKMFFDPKGLILAHDADNRIVGMVHAGFAKLDQEQHVDTSQGTINMILVDPKHRRKSLGSQLLEKAQQYLADRGAVKQFAGGMFPINPFYLGLYGGSELPGVLESEPSGGAFFLAKGYERHATAAVYQRRIDRLSELSDVKSALLSRNVEIQVESWPMTSDWWQANTLGSIPSLKYEIRDRVSGDLAGWAWVVDMEPFSTAWQVPVVGITEFYIQEPFRRKGFGRLLLHRIMKHLRDQAISLVEVQTMEDNDAARGMYESLEFRQIDRGIIYRLPDLKTPTSSLGQALSINSPRRRMRDQGPAIAFRRTVQA